MKTLKERMIDYEARLTNLEANLCVARYNAATPIPAPERWIPKPGSRTLCWISDLDENKRTSVGVITGMSDDDRFLSLSQCEWNYATPLTQQDVAELTYNPEIKTLKRCCDCKYALLSGKTEPCQSCVSYVHFQAKQIIKPSRYDWSKAHPDARYWTTDSSGRQDQWIGKAKFNGEYWYHRGSSIVSYFADYQKPCPDAADSLEERQE